MADIFVCYRRGDSRGDAGRLADSLDERFERSQIFRDVESLEGGSNYKQAIDTAIRQVSVMLAVIGPRWLSITDDEGNRRLDDPDDFIVLEIGSALDQGVTVIPVLVGGAQMPAEADLPVRLRPLASQQAVELSDSRWDYDMQRLVARLQSLPGLRKPLREWLLRVLPGPLWVKVPLAILAVVIGLGVITQVATRGADPAPVPGLQLLAVRLAEAPWAESNCVQPYDCDSRPGREISSLVRLQGADVRHDPQTGELHLVLTLIWVLREGETNLFHRGYTGKIYYTAAAQPNAEATVIGTFVMRDHSLRPFNGLLAYTFGWLEIPFLLGRDTVITAEIKRRLEVSPALRALAN